MTDPESKPPNRRLGKICLFVAVVLIGGKIAVYSQLEHTEPDVYTPCSTLCAGQTVSLVFLLTAMRKDVFNLELIKSIPRITWLWMTIGTLLFTVISPMLVFNAVKTVNVTRITIIQRSEVIFLLFLAKPLGIAEKWPSKWEIGNCFLIALGIVLTLLLSYEYFHPVSGGYLMHIVSNDELMIFISTLCDPLSIIINKRFVTKVPIGFFVCYRQILGTILYHGIALLRGVDVFCFTSSTVPKLWINMLWFGPCFTAIPKVCILYAMFNCEPITLTFGTNMLFLIQLAFAAIIRGENPCQVHIIGIAIITFAIISGLAREVKRSFNNKGLSQQGKLVQAAETGEVDAEGPSDIQYQALLDDDEGVEGEEHPLMTLYNAISSGPDPSSEDEEMAGKRINVFHDPGLQKIIVGDV